MLQPAKEVECGTGEPMGGKATHLRNKIPTGVFFSQRTSKEHEFNKREACICGNQTTEWDKKAVKETTWTKVTLF